MDIFSLLKQYKKKYPMAVVWRLKSHAKIIGKHLNDNEKIIYAFAGQKNESNFDLFHTFVVVVTDKRLILACKRLIFGYFFYSITPDLFNDLTVSSGIIWGKITIDTVKEEIIITNLDKNSLAEIETSITKNMTELKKKYKEQI